MNPNIFHTTCNNTSGHTLSVGSLNVCGLKRRILYPEFIDLAHNFDILCLSETKLLDTDVISCEEYTFFSHPRKQKFYRRSGGIGFLVRNRIANFVTVVESKSEYIAWLRVSKQYLGTEQDMMIATIYIPPQQSRFFNDDEFDLFEQEIASVRSNFDYIYLLGDFNAQTATMPDYTVLDPFLSEFFNFDAGTIEHMDQKCVLEKYNLQINRSSKDPKKNNHGFKIIDLCKNNNLKNNNGRFGEDKNVGAMTFRGLSVIDYAMASSQGIKFAQNFKITDVDSLFSDGHALLSLDIRTNATAPNPPNYHQHMDPIRNINPHEYECFKNGIDKSKLEGIKELLENAERNCTPEMVNSVVKNICDLFRGGAETVRTSRKPTHFYAKKSTDKPWFGRQCETARTKYFLA